MSVFTNPASRSADEAQRYIAGLFALLGDRRPDDVLASTTAELTKRIDGKSAEDLSRPEKPGKWSIRQVVRHLADADLVWGWRLRMILAQDRPQITGYDQDLWADRLGYAHADVQQSLELFDVLRRSNLDLIDRASPDDLERVGMHAERGPESVAHLMKLYAGHDLLHLNQIDRITASF